MKGYNVANGYMGYINGHYRLFSTESEYEEFFLDSEADDK